VIVVVWDVDRLQFLEVPEDSSSARSEHLCQVACSVMLVCL
jgi:hypothetical protein